MTDEFILVASRPGHTDDVLAWLLTVPGVTSARRVEYGHFDILLEVVAPTHLAVQTLIANKLRFHVGVDRVDELGDRDEAAPVLRAISHDPQAA